MSYISRKDRENRYHISLVKSYKGTYCRFGHSGYNSSIAAGRHRYKLKKNAKIGFSTLHIVLYVCTSRLNLTEHIISIFR